MTDTTPNIVVVVLDRPVRRLDLAHFRRSKAVNNIDVTDVYAAYDDGFGRIVKTSPESD